MVFHAEKPARLAGLRWIVLSALLVGAAGAAAFGQGTGPAATSRPAQLTHAERVAQAAKPPILGIRYRPADAKPLTDEEKADIAKSDSLMSKAAQLREQGDYGSAAKAAAEAGEIRKRILGEPHFLTISAAVLAKTLAQFAAAGEAERKDLAQADKDCAAAEEACLKGEYAAAGEAAARSLKIRERVLGKDHPEAGLALYAAGKAEVEDHDADAAEPALTRALAILKASYGEAHPQVAVVLDRLGWLDLNRSARRGNDEQGMKQAAERERQAVRILRETVGETRETAEAQDNLATVQQVYTHELEEALANRLRALVIRRQLLGAEDRDVGVSLSNLALLYDQMGFRDEVLPLRQQALAIFEKALGPDHPYTITERLNLAAAHERRGQWKQAVDLLERVLKKDPAQPGAPAAPNLVDAWARLGMAYLETDRAEEAKSAFERAFKLVETLHSSGQADDSVSALEGLARGCRKQRVLGEAIKAYELLRTWEPMPRGSPNVATQRSLELAELYLDVGRLQEAESLLSETLRRTEKQKGNDAVDPSGILQGLSLVEERLGKLPEAERLAEQALTLADKKNIRRDAAIRALVAHRMGRVLMLEKKYDLAKFHLEDAKAIYEQRASEAPGGGDPVADRSRPVAPGNGAERRGCGSIA